MTVSDQAARRLALIVATSAYDDDGLAQLVSPAQDAAEHPMGAEPPGPDH